MADIQRIGVGNNKYPSIGEEMIVPDDDLFTFDSEVISFDSTTDTFDEEL
jgi:hypothetical protein